MSIWDLREAIESAVPAWVAVVVLVFGLSVAVYGIVTRRRRRQVITSEDDFDPRNP